MKKLIAPLLTLPLLAAPALAEPLLWGFQAEQFEYRERDGEDGFAWDFDLFVGRDEGKFVWRSEGEMGLSSGDYEGLDNQLLYQFPISPFFDGVAGVHASTPNGEPDRYNAVLGARGLAPQWFEIDAGLYLSDHPYMQVEVEYEGLLTNRLILVPSLEVTMPLKDDAARNQGAGGATVEVGARLSYDLIDRAVAPYVGFSYEKSFGDTGDMLRAAGEDTDEFSLVFGTRLMF